MRRIETEYLIVGAGACGMAFADMLLTRSQADIVIVDRRHRPGGHWRDAYPFVRLHQPSAIYGVDSTTLGLDRIDTFGPNAGFYERASAAEICAYYDELLERRLLPSGRVRFFGLCDYAGDLEDDHLLTCRLTGEKTRVAARQRVVDATFLETAVPATEPVAFDVEPGTRLVPPNALVALTQPARGYTVIGGGKTGMDCCVWLLQQGVAPESIRWVRPRDAWTFDRAFLQPLDLVIQTIEGVASSLGAMAQAEDVDDLFRRLEAVGAIHRLDPTVQPRMFRGAILSENERASLRTITNVVRLGGVRRLGVDRIELDEGAIETSLEELHINCTARGLRTPPTRPVFAQKRITPQSIRFGLPCFNSALTAFLEASDRDDDERNRLAPPHSYPCNAFDLIPVRLKTMRVEALWSQEPDLTSWIANTRLNLRRGLAEKQADPRLREASARISRYMDAAADNLDRFYTQESVNLPADEHKSIHSPLAGS